MEEDRYTRITLRIPKELHARLDAEADATSKSLNAEIVGRLEESFRTVRQEIRREIEAEVAAMQNRIELLSMRFDLARSRSDNLEIRTHLISSESARLAKEAKTDEDFAAVQKKLDQLKDVEAEAEKLRQEMNVIIVDRESALRDLQRLRGIIRGTTEALEERIRAGKAARVKDELDGVEDALQAVHKIVKREGEPFVPDKRRNPQSKGPSSRPNARNPKA
jgi:hypothetical protein